MFLFTIFGPLVYVFTAFFIIFKEYKNPDFESKYVLNSATSFILELVFAMSILTQIPLGFLAGRVAIPSSISTRNRTKIFLFKQIILHMAICNGDDVVPANFFRYRGKRKHLLVRIRTAFVFRPQRLEFRLRVRTSVGFVLPVQQLRHVHVCLHPLDEIGEAIKARPPRTTMGNSEPISESVSSIWGTLI